ncbi:VacB/RNase II family 3'-5' exoribonuclease [Sphingomonas cannabina]|uniref:ribonuclease R family protein n=1 Tax=Sphingomonas cannabina TaxID=2899123 RepID=UPI001F41CED7|nr:VacB/RNase II family 3'-5' exoribonuclease [Sphingomonas cannabina]UIJ45821.1 VacB/RNase II family 3'-5' exoribonuclease [Sphingomonas cannabina]
MAKRAGLPTRQQILDFIASSDQPAGKREIARAFGLHGQDKIALKALLKDMGDEGLIDAGPGRAFHAVGGLPKVTVLRVVDVDDGGNVWAQPERWEAEGVPEPRLRVRERKHGRLGVGDRILARTEEAGKGWIAHPMKTLPKASETMIGVLREEGGRLFLQGVEKKERRDFLVSDAGGAEAGDLVMAEKAGRPPRMTARVVERLGDPFAPRSFSLIAIHRHEIPHVFSEELLDEARRVAELKILPGTGRGTAAEGGGGGGLAASEAGAESPLHQPSAGPPPRAGEDLREDLRQLPIVAIDPVDARDHDDAVWAQPNDEGGWDAIVAIADVSFYVRPGSLLDREARRRGNSVYFPDRVVPMLPEVLSADVCSLKEGVDRAALACHFKVSKAGAISDFRFTRAVVRIAANIPYEDAQAAIDGIKPHALTETALKPLWDCWRALYAAREKREPLDLDLPERRVVLDEKGRILSVAPRERLDAHKLIEDYMIAANVAAAKALEAKKLPVMYRIHEPPAREKLVALKDYLATFDVEFALGQVIRPATFNRILDRIGDADFRPQVMEQVLRTQTQAYYGPQNAGHFGLALGSYAHFTSPIRRYADLLVHRALVEGYRLGPGGLTTEEVANFERIGEGISQLERRAMEAERETIDRYVAAYLAEHVGEVMEARITGVQSFGFFATVDGVGGDGLVPARDLGSEYYRWDEAGQRLVGEHSGTEFALGQRLQLRLVEANPVSGALRFELPEGKGAAGGGERPKRVLKRRGRPANIRHQGRKR